jgi:hypothetical protein
VSQTTACEARVAELRALSPSEGDQRACCRYAQSGQYRPNAPLLVECKDPVRFGLDFGVTSSLDIRLDVADKARHSVRVRYDSLVSPLSGNFDEKCQLGQCGPPFRFPCRSNYQSSVSPGPCQPPRLASYEGPRPIFPCAVCGTPTV